METTFIRERITELRLKKGVSEYQMSYALGHNKNYIRAITSGRSLPSVEGLFAIIDYFEMTPAEFFDKDYPQMIRKAIDYMEKLDDEDMFLLLNIIQMFCQKK
ncbi:helix-turn-helix transcriptional regulator [Lachnospiraceae bacterium 48-21]|jgi:transcriptional regulator with XRE-family HTH domain